MDRTFDISDLIHADRVDGFDKHDDADYGTHDGTTSLLKL